MNANDHDNPELTLAVHLRGIADALRQVLAELYTSRPVGFALLIFDVDEAGHKTAGDESALAYISNARRQDMIEALRDCASRIENGHGEYTH